MRIRSATAFALAAAIVWGSVSARSVPTETGVIEGTVQDGIAVYKGVPFAAPPVGELRWRAPEMAKPWSGVRKTNEFAPACAGVPFTSEVLDIHPLPSSEDCLYLNVWTPAKSPSSRLPVMVWIHGGGFATGATSEPIYDGSNFARKGVVLVTIAYRVGPFGFLAHPELSAESRHGSGNYGLLDQIAALKWVRRNIAAFGGDPHRVTIFGQSAGGISVSMLCASPLAAGLFQGAISESGGSFGPARYDDEGGVNVPTLAVAERYGVTLFSQLGVKNLQEARKLAPETIFKAPGAGFTITTLLWPNFDGYVLPGDEYELYSAGLQNDTPILIGTNLDEGAVFPRQTDLASFTSQVRAHYGEYARRILGAYPAGSDAEAARSSRDLARDTAFVWHTWAWARLQSRTGKARAYVYYFEHRPPYPDTLPFKDFGAIHGAELGYVFGNLMQPRVAYTAQDHALSAAIISYWTNFAASGDPNGTNLPLWPAFNNRQPIAMHFEDVPRAGPVPNIDKLRVLDGYYAWRRAHRGSPE